MWLWVGPTWSVEGPSGHGSEIATEETEPPGEGLPGRFCFGPQAKCTGEFVLVRSVDRIKLGGYLRLRDLVQPFTTGSVIAQLALSIPKPRESLTMDDDHQGGENMPLDETIKFGCSYKCGMKQAA